MTAQPSGTLLVIELYYADCHLALKWCLARGPSSAHSSSMQSTMDEVFSTLSSCAIPFPTSCCDFFHCCHLMMMVSGCAVAWRWSKCFLSSCTPQFVHSLSIHFKFANLSDVGQSHIDQSVQTPIHTNLVMKMFVDCLHFSDRVLAYFTYTLDKRCFRVWQDVLGPLCAEVGEACFIFRVFLSVCCVSIP